ncbi:MAG: hypothetical protein EXS69_01390 [Candidatus Zambryskibacteria bacterium]|nr:hypothetical protein [Candidatus Zambryskibacteria bacterium]
MKRTFIIIVSIIILALGVWYFFFRDSSTTLVEIIRTGLPFGSNEDINIPAIDTKQGTADEKQFDEIISAETKLFRISNTPVAGFVAFNTPQTNSKQGSTNTVVRYIDRATGHIFDAIIPSATTTGVIQKTRITNNTLPKIYEAHFRSDGGMVLLRALRGDSDTIDNLTLALTAPKATSASTSSPQVTNEFYSISATNMRGSIDSVAPGAGNTLYYTLTDTGAVVSSTFVGTELKTLFTSAFTNWRLARLGAGIMLYTKASASTPGYAYSVSGGTLTKLLGPLNGLTAIGNSNGKKILYSYTENNTTKLFSKDLARGDSLEILPATISEKCAWSAREANSFFCGTPISSMISTEPDEWYQGKTHFSDYIWKFDTNSEIAQLILNPKTNFDLEFDIYEPKLSPNEDYMIFINKRDLTLWGVRL